MEDERLNFRSRVVEVFFFSISICQIEVVFVLAYLHYPCALIKILGEYLMYFSARL